MRFFDSRIGRTVYGGRYFVTSERFDYASPRLYTIRQANDDGSVDTVGDFQQFATREDAAREAERLALLDQAEEEGYEAGKAAGSWVIDGNTSEDAARSLLQGLDDGDPLAYDCLPRSPLSGEWADDPTPRDLLESLGLDEDDPGADDILARYEEGFSRGVEDEVCRSARAIL